MAALYKINYKSDFVLTINSDAGWAVPFCIKFWTGMPSQAYFAGFDGENYVNCRVGETPTQLLVMFDDHHMPIGELKMQIAYHTTIEEFPDRKFDEVTNPTNVTVDIDGTEYQVMLDFTGETGAEIDFSMPSSGVMSVNGKIGYVTLNAEDVGAQPTIADLATIRSGAAAGATAVQPATLQEGLATKQNVIEDLATIRSGAAAGATAVQPAALQEGLAGKQDTISDLATIRSGAAAGATAVQPAGLTPIESALQTIEAVIPSAATAQNQLADKNFVNSSISTNTANFVGTFETLAELQAVQNPTNNDYGFVIETDAQGNEYYDRYKYVAASQQWLFEYKVESTPFTAAQWAAIQSGITSALVTKLTALPTNAELQQTLDGKADAADIPTALSQLSQDSTHRTVTDAEKSTWNGKQAAISDLATIRSGAAAGATAVQPAALQEGLAGKQDTISDLATIRSGAEAGATAVQPDEMTAALAGKQNVIEDLSTIRSGAAAGATAVQPAAMNTALAAKQDTLTFDNTPTANSDNPVKSGGIKTALDAKQTTISTVNVTVDNNTGTPSGSASVSGSTLSLSFQNLKGATGERGLQGETGPRGERGLPGESGVTGDVSGFTVIQTIDPSATYGATDIAGAATVQATNAELTELEGEVTDLDLSVGDAWKVESQGRIANGVWSNDFVNYKHVVIPIYSGDNIKIVPNSTTYYTVLKGYPKPVAGETPDFATGYSDRILLASTKNFIAPNDAKWLYILTTSNDVSLMPSSITINGIEKLANNSTSNAISILSQNIVEVENELALGFDERPIEKTDNVLDVAPVLRGAAGISEVNGVYIGTLNSFNGKEIPVTCEAGSYTISYVGYCEGNSTTSGSGFRIVFRYSDNTSESVGALLNNVSEFTQIYANSNRNKTLVGIGLTFGSGSANIVHIKEIQLRKGTTVLPYIPPYCAADYNGRALAKEETASVSRYNNVSAYFSGPNKPVITTDGNNIVVTLPSAADNSALRIYDNSGNVVVTKTCNGEIFTLSSNEALIMSGVGTGGGTLSKVSRTSVGNSFVLLYNSYASVGGLLSKYYVNSEFDSIKNVDTVPTKDSHKFMDSDGINKALASTAYFSGPNKPTFSRNGYTLTVTFPSATQTSNLRIYDKKGNVLTFKRCNGEEFTLNLLQALVMNDDKTFEVVARTEENNRFVLVENNYPSVGGLIAGYYYSQVDSDLNDKINANNDKTDIINLNPPSIYSDLIGNLAFGKFVSGQTRKSFFSFLHYSDIHGNTENVDRLMKFKTEYNSFINDVICSGDIVLNNYENDNILSDYQSTIAVIGNHDAWVEGDLQELDPEIQAIVDYSIDATHHVIKQKPVYDKFLAGNISNWGVTQPSDAATAGKCYFYKDYTNNTGVKLRLIFLDCMHYNVGEDIAGGSSVQNAWLESVLADAKTNSIPVAICVHYFPTSNYSKVECSYTNTEIVSSDYLPSLATETVNSFIHPSSGTGGEFICWFVGHCHCDVIGKSNTYQDQVFIAVDTAKHDRAIMGNSYRGSGNKSQDAFNIMSFDTESKLIKIVRVGSDTTRELKLKRRVVYRYAADGQQQAGLVLSE